MPRRNHLKIVFRPRNFCFAVTVWELLYVDVAAFAVRIFWRKIA